MAVVVASQAHVGTGAEQVARRKKLRASKFMSSPPVEFQRQEELVMKEVGQRPRGCDSERQGCEQSFLPLPNLSARHHAGYTPLPTDDAQDDGAISTDWLSCYWSARVVESCQFQTLSIIAIVGNAAVIGFETDHPELKDWEIVENCFLAWFVLECGLRFAAVGPRMFFCGDSEESHISHTARRSPQTGGDALWNIFDFCIVSVGVITLLQQVSKHKQSRSGSGSTILRIVRLARTLRILRVIRVLRFLKQLYLLAYGFIEGALAVFWVAVLTGIIVYICAVVLVRSYGRLPDDAPFHDLMTHNFHSISRAMWTLFGILASPTLSVYDELLDEYPVLLCFFVVFVLFGSFGISGLLTGVISESIIDKNTARIEEQRYERENKRRLIESLSREVYAKLDIFKKGAIARQEFQLQRSRIESIFRTAGVPIPKKDYESLFALMDLNDNGTVEQEEFVHCILELCDEVRPMSIMELHSQLSTLHTKLMRLFDKVERLQEGVNDTRLNSRLNRRRETAVKLDTDQLAQLRELHERQQQNTTAEASSDSNSELLDKEPGTAASPGSLTVRFAPAGFDIQDEVSEAELENKQSENASAVASAELPQDLLALAEEEALAAPEVCVRTHLEAPDQKLRCKRSPTEILEEARRHCDALVALQQELLELPHGEPGEDLHTLKLEAQVESNASCDSADAVPNCPSPSSPRMKQKSDLHADCLTTLARFGVAVSAVAQANAAAMAQAASRE